MGSFSNILIIVITHCCSNLAIQTDSFTLNPSCIFWMTCDTKYIQTSNLKSSLKIEKLYWTLTWINNFQSIRYGWQNNEKQTLISHQTKCILRWKRFLWISNEQYLVRRTKYVASLFLQWHDVCFTETALGSFQRFWWLSFWCKYIIWFSG